MKTRKMYNSSSNLKRMSITLALSSAMLCPATMMAAGNGSTALSPQAVHQNGVVKGTVVDETGQPMIGVTIIPQSGTKNGTITDLDGNFTVNAPIGSTIKVSYTGYKDKVVKVTSGTLSLKMEPDVLGLDDVVVIGYGTQKKRDLTGAVASVKSEDITLTPSSNPMQSLQGRVSGLDITKEDGRAGSGVKIQLRGNRSFSDSGTAPLFIIDGMPGDYSTLNPNDIESIEVLKDASSTAVYGMEGANGVVLITTKGGKAGKLSVNVNAYFGINSWSEMPKVRQGESYIEGLRQANRNAGTYVDDEILFQSNPNYYKAYQDKKFINWADELLHTGTVQNYSVSLSGGTDKTKAYMSMNFSDEKGQYRDDNYKVYSTNIRIDNKVNNWFSAGIAIQGSYVYKNTPFAKLEDAMTAIPYGDLYDENGNYTTYPVEGDTNYINLLINNKSNYRGQGQNTKVYINPYIKITPFKGFSWESRINGTLTHSRSNSFTGQGSYNFIKSGGNVETDTKASTSQSNYYRYKWENILTYNFNIGKEHNFVVTGVSSYEHGRSEGATASGIGILNNSYLWNNLDNAVTRQSSSSYSMSKRMGWMGRINYSYLGRYLASVSVRHDGDSRLAKDEKWQTFPAFSLGWRISDEKFMESTKNWLDNLKLRVGYGETGSTSNISPYASTSKIEQSYLTIGGEKITTYGYSKEVANKKLTWERSKSWNIGLDAAFLNSRIDLSMDWYLTNTSNVIWHKNLPVTGGAYNSTTQYLTNVNLAETRNKGIELTLNTRNIVTKDFKWNSTLTFNYNKEEITKLMGTANDKVINGDYVYSVGSAVNSFYHYKLNGIWQTNEADDAACFGMKPGYIKVDVPGIKRHVDENGSVYYTKNDAEGVEHRYDASNPYALSADDYQVIGHNSPDWSLGFQNTFKYKDFDLSIYMYMRWGQMINYKMLTNYDPTGKNNYPEYFNVWSENNPSNDFPAMNASISDKLSYYPGFAALSYVDGSFFKIKNITLGYTLPTNICKRLGLSNLRVYGTITNPLIVSKSHLLKDYDPEMNGNYNYPLTKQLVFGLNIAF